MYFIFQRNESDLLTFSEHILQSLYSGSEHMAGGPFKGVALKKVIG